MTILLEMDSGNLRQVRHWEPKLRAFLKTAYPIWVITVNEQRVATLCKWTVPLLQEAAVESGKCVFGIYDDIIQHGFFGASWWRTDGSITDLKPRSVENVRLK
jgi:hypothetical protein